MISRVNKVSVLKLILEDDFSKFNLRGDSLKKIIDALKQFPVQLKSDPSRYSKSENSNELALVFSEEIKSVSTANDDVKIGVFMKRRGNNRPWEDDGEGNIVELTLQDETHEIAEVSYIGLHIQSGILFWTYNPMVGGINQFADYLNDKIKMMLTLGILNSVPELQTGLKRLVFYYLGFPDSVAIFKDKMKQVQSFDFHLAGNAEYLSEAFLFQDDSRDKNAIRLLREIARQSNCAKITFNLVAERPERIKSKGKTDIIRKSLNKNFILDIYNQTVEHLRGKKDSKFNVRGEVIDDDTRVLDLVHSRLTYPLEVKIDEKDDVFTIYIAKLRELVFMKISEAVKYYDVEVE